MENPVGYRFHPTGEELVNHYLKNKILGRSWLVDDAISEINICSYDPPSLPRLSKIKSDDHVWYFFSPKEYTSGKKKGTKRTTRSGYWKATGVDRKIKDNRGNRGEIGLKKTLVYYQGKVANGVWTPWVMHEYHITCLPEQQRTYVICQVMYKGEDEIPSGDILSEPSQSFVSNPNTVYGISTPSEVEQPGQEIFNGLSMNDLDIPVVDEPMGVSRRELLGPDVFNDINANEFLQAPYIAEEDNEFLDELRHVSRENVEYLFATDQFMSRSVQNYNEHMPKKSLSGIIANCSSDSDAESISAMSYQGTSSPNDSVGSSDKHFPTCGDEISVELSTSKKSLESQSVQPHAITQLHSQVKHQRSRPLKQKVMKQGKHLSQAYDPSTEESSMVKTERKRWFIMEESMERRRTNPPYIYLTNIIISFILLACLISDIISVLLSANS